MPDLGAIWTQITSNALIQFSVRFIVLYVFFLYLAMVFWTVRDAQQRTENLIMPYLAGLMVVVLNLFGLFLYLIVRPRETLGEAYERQLAEESLLSEAEQRLVCPTCHERVQEEFVLCPTCRTRLKRVCPSCAKLIRPEWSICPFCAKDFDERDWTVHAGGRATATAPSRDATERVSPERVSPERVTPERVTPERVTPERVSPERVTPGRATTT